LLPAAAAEKQQETVTRLVGKVMPYTINLWLMLNAKFAVEYAG
jgi:hypothetical protein